MKYTKHEIDSLLAKCDPGVAGKLVEALDEMKTEVDDLARDLSNSEAECLELQDEVSQLESELDEKNA